MMGGSSIPGKGPDRLTRPKDNRRGENLRPHFMSCVRYRSFLVTQAEDDVHQSSFSSSFNRKHLMI